MLTMKKTISIILAVIMLLCIIPFSASAATQIQLKVNDPLVKIVPPTVSPTEFEYGKLYGELEITGGEVYYDGKLVEGKFTCGSRFVSRVVPVTTTNMRLYFEPTDTTTYAASNAMSYNEKYPVENWPVLKVIPLKAELDGELTVSGVSVGSTLGTATITAKIINSKTKEEVTDGKWKWDHTETSDGSSQQIYIDGTYGLTWSCTGYEDLKFTVDVKAIPSDVEATGIVEKPLAIDDNLEYFDGMTAADIKLEGGKAVYKGEVIAGHFEWRSPDVSLATFVGKGYSSQVKFVPDDQSLAETFASVYVYVAATAPPAREFEITKQPDALVFEYQNSYGFTNANRQGFEFANIEASKVRLEWEENLYNYEVGSYPEIEVTMLVNKDTTWAEKKLMMPVRIVNKITDDPYGTITVKEDRYGVEGEINIELAFSDEGKTGTAVIKVNDEVIAENIAPTYAHGSGKRVYSASYIAPETGTYTVTAEYIPGETDSLSFTNSTLSASIDVVVRTARRVTVVGGTAWDDVSYVGDKMEVTVDMKDNFKCWVFTDAKGNVIPSADLGITDEDLTKTTVQFTMPDYDITATAKEKGLLPDINIGNGDSFFAQVKAFFENLFGGFGEGTSECPVLNWLKNVIEIIVTFFTDLFNGMAC